MYTATLTTFFFFLARLSIVIDHFVIEIITKEKEDVESQSVEEDG